MFTDVVSWLNQNAGALTLLFSFVVATATVFYVILTSQLVRETRLVREGQVQPHLVIRIQSNQVAFGSVDLTVENLGPGPAYNVSFNCVPNLELETNPKRSLSDIGFLRNGFSYLAPQQAITTYLMQLIGLGNEKLEGPDRLHFIISANYADVLGKRHAERFDLDFSHFVGLIRLGSPPLPELAKNLESIERHIAHIATGWSKVKVVNYSLADVRQEYDEARLAQLSPQLMRDATAMDESPPDQKGEGSNG